MMLLAAAAGCAKARVSNPPQPGACEGDRVAVVTNNWTRGIDVYARQSGPLTPIVIGTVLPGGREEFVLPFDATYVFLRPTERAQGGIPLERQTSIRYLCRR